MNVSEVGNVLSALDTSQTKTESILGKDEFLKILVTQLKTQDPLNPMSDTDFIAQMAQFSALEQMQNLNSSFSFSQAVGLVGKTVVANVADSITGECYLISGTVDCVYLSGSVPYVKVGGYHLSLDNIEAVYSSSSADE